MAQRHYKSQKQKHRDKNIKTWTLWLSLGAAIGKFVQVVFSFFHGSK